MNNQLTVFVNSCDYYSDAWYPFFTFIDLFGGKLKEYPIVLAAEKKDFSYEGLNLTVLKYKRNKTWGERIIHELSRIKTEYIFFDIEDYFLLKPFDDSLFQIAINYMIDNPNVGYMKLSNTPDDSIDDYSITERPLPDNRLHMSTSIWRTEYFIKLLRKHESIWDFERYSCIRAQNYPYKCVQFSSKKPCYEYQQPRSINNGSSIIGDGYGIVRGKWLTSNVDLFAKYNIEVDFSNLGFYKPKPQNEVENKSQSFFEKFRSKSKLIKKVDNRVKKYKRKKEKKKREKSFK